MLRIERQSRLRHRLHQPLIDGTQARDGSEQAEAPAARGGEEFAIGGRELVHILAIDIVHYEDAARIAVVEGRVIAHPLDRIGQMHGTGAHLCIGPVLRRFRRSVLECR